MTLVPITELDDPRISPYRDLKATNETRYLGQLIAEGDKLAHRLIDSGLPVSSLLLADRYAAEFESRVAAETPIYVVPERLISQIVGFNFHRGVLACGMRPANADLEALCLSTPLATLIVCPEVHDPENLGAILRIGAVFGVTGVALGKLCCDPFSRRVLRVSMGAALRVPIARVANLDSEVVRLQEAGLLEAWAAVTDGAAEAFDRLSRPQRLALVLGSEGQGLPAEWRALCAREVTIPMRTDFDSLNVAVAAGVLLYQLAR